MFEGLPVIFAHDKNFIFEDDYDNMMKCHFIGRHPQYPEIDKPFLHKKLRILSEDLFEHLLSITPSIIKSFKEYHAEYADLKFILIRFFKDEPLRVMYVSIRLKDNEDFALAALEYPEWNKL